MGGSCSKDDDDMQFDAPFTWHPDRWWESEEINETVSNYYDRNGRFPTEELRMAKDKLQGMLSLFLAALKKNKIVCTVDSAGSAHYEKTHIPRWDGLLELDVNLVIDGSNIDVSSLADHSGGEVLTCRTGRLPASFYEPRSGGRSHGTRRVSAKGVIETFYKVLETVDIDEVTFKRSGPAVRLQVCEGSEVWFTADIVPVISIPGKGNFVAKKNQWWESFSQEERRFFPDDDTPYARRCLRILKAVCSRHYTVSDLNSYVLKNVFFHELHKKQSPFYWTRDTMAARTMDLLRGLRDALKDGHISPVFGGDWINLLSSHSQQALDKMYRYVNLVCTDEDAFKRAFRQ